jgi:hypothetical protein
MISELAPYMSRYCFMLGGMGVDKTALLILARASSVYFKCAFGHRDVVKAVPI